MMVPDEVDMEHEVVKCGMCIVKEMNVVKGEKDLLMKEVGELRKEIGELKKEVGELRVQSINKGIAEVKTKEEDSWAIVAKKMKSHNVFERLEKVESDMIVKKSVIRKEVKSTNEEETRKKRIMIFNLKNKTGKSDVECVKDVFGKMGAGQGRRLSWPLTILAPYILYTKGRHRGGVRRKPHPYAYPLCHCIKLLCNFRVSVKVNHSTLVYIVYYNVKLLALIIYKCINYITLNTSYIFIL